MKRPIIVGCLSCSLLSIQAQEAVDLGEMDVSTSAESKQEQTVAATGYESFDPLDSGRSVIDSSTVAAGFEGGTDTTSLLQSLPFVQMDTERQAGTAEAAQSLRPSDFSISGGNLYDNSILIDGVSATSIMDVSSKSKNDFNEVFGQTSQTLYVDPSLIGSIEVLDSNISARYGDFTGGVVDMKLREPERKFGFSATAGIQNDNMVSYRKSGYGEIAKEKPEFTKYQSALSLDLPISERLFVLASVSRSESAVAYNMSEGYGGRKFETGDRSSNYLLKALYEHSDTLSFDGQLVYSPYRSEHQPDNSINSLNINRSNGLSSYVSAKGLSGIANWQHKISYQISDASRKWDGDRFQWPSKAPSIDWCDSTNCAEGGYGALDQTQQDATYQFTFDRPLAGGDISLGSELRYTLARKVRPQDNRFYTGGKVMASGVTANCAPGDPACRDDVVLSQYNDYAAYDASVELFSQALWAEYFRQIGAVGLRAGTRVTYDNFLANVNVAPRLTANWAMFDNTHLTLGANRYYAANMVGYAIRSQYPNNYLYKRSVDTATGEVGDWQLSSTSRSTDYGQNNLKTPYSDELTAALTFPAPLDGNFRVKGVYRQNRDGFANSQREKVDFEPGNGSKPTSTTLYTLTNDGKSDYKGLALEWHGKVDKHSFNANITWSKTKTLGDATSYFDYTDPLDQVYYDGKVIGMDELYALSERSNFAAPVRAALGWTAQWNNSLRTNLSLQYRGGYDFLGDSGDDVQVDGTSYDRYEKIVLGSFTTVNANARYALPKWREQQLSVDVRVTNLFNRTPEIQSNSSSASYRLGRSAWVGLNYNY
ncbi:MAG: TonB-dependent receptor plug domain-containing protein [Vibrionaceae bacterium]